MLGSLKFQQLMKSRYETMKANLLKQLKETRKVVVCLDGWTKKGMSASFLGISVSFFDRRRRIPKHALLSLVEIEHPHTGEALSKCLETCLQAWEIPPSKVLLIISDNGANMIKAIRLLQKKEREREMKEIADESDEENEEADENESEDGENVDTENVVDVEHDSESADVDDMMIDSEFSLIDENDEDSDDDDMPLAHQWSMELPETVVYRRLPCMAHCLQLIIKIIYKHTDYAPVISKVRNIVRRIRKSSQLMSKLIKRCGKSVIMDCTTRWNSTYHMIRRFIDLKSAINEVIVDDDNDEMDLIIISEWKLLSEIVSLLEPFATHTDILQTDTLSLSNVVPALLDLEVHLQNFKSAKKFIQVKLSTIIYTSAINNKFNATVTVYNTRNDVCRNSSKEIFSCFIYIVFSYFLLYSVVGTLDPEV